MIRQIKDYWREVYCYKRNCIIHEWRQNLMSKIVEDNLDKINSVLEIGCCSGSNLMAIRKKAPFIKLCGMDLCDSAIAYGKEQTKDIDLGVGDIKDLSAFGNKSFDLVFTAGMLMYLDCKVVTPILAELLRISKKFIINLERQGKDNVFQELKTIDYKLKMFSTDYIKKYKIIDPTIDIVKYQLSKKLPAATAKELKNVKDFILVNLSDERLNIF